MGRDTIFAPWDNLESNIKERGEEAKKYFHKCKETQGILMEKPKQVFCLESTCNSSTAPRSPVKDLSSMADLMPIEKLVRKKQCRSSACERSCAAFSAAFVCIGTVTRLLSIEDL